MNVLVAMALTAALFGYSGSDEVWGPRSAGVESGSSPVTQVHPPADSAPAAPACYTLTISWDVDPGFPVVVGRSADVDGIRADVVGRFVAFYVGVPNPLILSWDDPRVQSEELAVGQTEWVKCR